MDRHKQQRQRIRRRICPRRRRAREHWLRTVDRSGPLELRLDMSGTIHLYQNGLDSGLTGPSAIFEMDLLNFSRRKDTPEE